ncbi:AMP-binding protein [Catenulispora yoronensis]
MQSRHEAQLAIRAAAGLADAGLRPGARFLLIADEPRDFVAPFLGAAASGPVAVPVPPPPRFAAAGVAWLRTLRALADATGAEAVCGSAAALAALEALEGEADSALEGGTDSVLKSGVDNALESGAEEADTERLGLRPVAVESIVGGEPSAARLVPYDPERLVYVQASSGSTSRPKAVAARAGALLANSGAMAEHWTAEGIAGGFLSWLPFNHDMGLVAFLIAPFCTQSSCFFMPTKAFARDPRVWMKAMQETGASITYAPNFAFAVAARRAATDPEGWRRSTCAGCGSSAAAENRSTLRRWSSSPPSTPLRASTGACWRPATAWPRRRSV